MKFVILLLSLIFFVLVESRRHKKRFSKSLNKLGTPCNNDSVCSKQNKDMACDEGFCKLKDGIDGCVNGKDCVSGECRITWTRRTCKLTPGSVCERGEQCALGKCKNINKIKKNAENKTPGEGKPAEFRCFRIISHGHNCLKTLSNPFIKCSSKSACVSEMETKAVKCHYI
jgi:hypothetical protein